MRKVKYKADESAGDKLKVRCQQCGCDTNHVVLKSIEELGSEPLQGEVMYRWLTSYQIIQCKGCDTISFRRLHSNSEDTEKYVDLYPYQSEGRQEIKEFVLLPPDLLRIYRETVSALYYEQAVLSGIGIRVIIETVSREKNAVGKDLYEKINHLVSLGVLTRDGADTLHKLRVLGNKAAHEVKAHSAMELNLAMDVIEHLLEAVYILPDSVKRILR